jgi:hypothetical protein
MEKINFKKLFKKQPDSMALNTATPWPGKVERDWRILVYCFAIGLASLSVFAWKIYLSDQIAGGYFVPEASSSNISVKVLDEKKLKADLLIMQGKQGDFVKLKTNPPKVVDPAL